MNESNNNVRYGDMEMEEGVKRGGGLRLRVTNYNYNTTGYNG